MPQPRHSSREAKEAKILEKLSPYHRELYLDDSITIPLSKAWASIDLVLLEWQRSRVSEENVENIAPVLLAINGNYKILKLFADKGAARVRELNNQKRTHA